MKNMNMKPFLYILGAFSIFVFVVTALIRGFDIRNFLNIIQLIPIVVTVDFFAYQFFIHFIWRWKILRVWLVPFPDLNGTWVGTIQTDWVDLRGVPIPVMLTIKQKFNSISCVMRTKEMESYSYVEGFYICNESQKKKLCYSYTSRPTSTLRNRSTPHDGTVLFNIIGKNAKKLEGEYWTQRNTKGTIKLDFRTKKLLDKIPGDLPQHPMQESGDIY